MDCLLSSFFELGLVLLRMMVMGRGYDCSRKAIGSLLYTAVAHVRYMIM